MNLFDVSMPIHVGMTVYKNKPEKLPRLEVTSDFATQHVHETRICMDAHCGTHIDAPLHMLPGGKASETLAPNQLMRHCRVLDLTGVSGGIQTDDLLLQAIQTGEFLLFKTRNSWDEKFNSDFVYLTEDGARYLANIGVSGVGIDALGIERSQPDHPTHKILFQQGAYIIEGLRLRDVPPGTYQMIALPLALHGSDAAPARVVLTSMSNAN
ncbi:cyclase family protein [Alicyclobacillaceae bacterium I2511]|nr:cyclase family protein [Alicyclobacillaceae bacterium I2511]